VQALSPAEKRRLADTETSNVAAYDCVLRRREFLLSKDKNRRHGPNRRWGKEAVRQTSIYVSTSIQRGASKYYAALCYF
jgi:hypothetical protein